MNSFKIYSLMLVIIILIYGCTDSYDSSDNLRSIPAIVIGADICQHNVSRVSDSGFADGDCMGVYVVDYEDSQPGTLMSEGNRANNLSFTYSEGNNSWVSPYDVYWKDNNTPVDVYGYYPYNSGLYDVNKYRFEVSSDQSIAGSEGKMGNYEASDFLWAKAVKAEPGTSVINLYYSHLMAGMSVSLKAGSGFSDSEWDGLEKQVMVCNLTRIASIDLSMGKVVATGNPDKHIIMASGTDAYRAVVVPQTVSAGKPIICINIAGSDYFFQKDDSFVLNGGKLHKFTIQVDKRSESGSYVLSLIDENITEWENDEVSHSFESNAYVVVHCPVAGSLKASLETAGHDYNTMRNLKLTGEITTEDFYFMRDEMSALEALNLKNVKLRKCKISDERVGTGNTFNAIEMDNVIPDEAFKDKLTLKNFVFPDSITRIGKEAFYNTTWTGDVIIPEGITHIGSAAFYQIVATNSLVLPNSLEYIGESAFERNKFDSELKLPARLKHVGDNAFYSYDSRLHGSFRIPENLVYWGKYAFGFEHSGLTCEELVIPQGISSVYEGAAYCMKAKRIVLHDGITQIFSHAFAGGNIEGELYLPPSVRIIGSFAFSEGKFTGNLKLPEKLLFLGNGAFSGCSHISGSLDIPESIEAIENECFMNCSSLESVSIPEYVTFIGDNAFANCTGLKSITCDAKEPPLLGSDVFMNINKDEVNLYVPEESVDAYSNAAGWKDFYSVSVSYELECGLKDVYTLRAGTDRTFIVNSQGPWEIVSKPDWCTLTATESDNNKTLVTLSVTPLAKGTGDRFGEIVFKLKDKDYSVTRKINQYDYDDEGTEFCLQTASKGKGVQIFLLGDGFDAQDIVEGRYIEAMRTQMENFFSIEPFHTYRDYFTVYTAITESPEKGIGSVVTVRETRFGTNYDNSYTLFTDYDKVRKFVLDSSSLITEDNIHDALIVLVTNSDEFGGMTEIWDDGSFISICPLSKEEAPHDARSIILHEAGGHGFAKLGEEEITHYDFITTCCCPICKDYTRFLDAKSRGWYQNLSLSGKMSDLPWAHLIYDPRFSDDVDVYEGGYNHARAVYRSEYSSIMGNYEPHFSAISRETIVRRILEIAGEEFDFETFATIDVQSRTEL